MTTPSEPARGNGLGIASLAAAILAVLVGGGIALVQAALIGALPISAYGALAAVRGVVIGVIALVALVLGLVSLGGRSPRKALAAAGTGIGAAQLAELGFSALFTLVQTLR